jgi:CelD/BcsL family acetyltransferase involved in cellulose biosynthesis
MVGGSVVGGALSHERQSRAGVKPVLEVAVLTKSAELDSLCADAESLIDRPLEPNVFYEPWMLSAALGSMSTEDVRIVVIRHRAGDVTGIFPLQLERRFRGLPVRALKSWRHPFCFLCTPLVSAVYASDTLRAFLDWVDSDAAPANLVEWEFVAADGAFHALLTEELSRRGRWSVHVQRYQRALLQASGTGQTSVSGKHLKEFRRLKRRLWERGQCITRVMKPGEPVEGWIEKFVALEALGWKGREGTALASDDRSRRFFAQMATTSAARGRIEMMAIELDGAPIAMKCNLLAGEGAFAFKIAYDERFSYYSPGVLLELFNMSSLAERSPHTQWMDSCATSHHFMIDRLWTARRELGNYLIASRGIACVMVRHFQRYKTVRDFLKRRVNREDHERISEVQSR